ncbi:antizyme inhibitor 1-like [Scleropages formosus]|uniref:antizyme inhibitor 1-like n=1 Tax=Scleropages formosus TaxID=113540 RepID=UPI0008790FD4|nr:antizyme inhibitor 1-like [Scleropages formosus]
MKGFADEPSYTIELLEDGTTLSDVIDNHIYEQALAEKNAFFVTDLGVLLRQHARWRAHMAQIRPYYPVRCNSSPAVIEILAALGVGFACSNKNDLVLVQDFGVSPENILYTGACKQLSHIKYAAKSGIDVLVCDNETEMCKIARCHPRAKLLLQMATESYTEATSMTFGSSLKGCRHLLENAQELDLQVVGVRFHIPTSCRDNQAYAHAVADARCVFDMGSELGFHMNILNIGGGFSGSEEQLEQIEGNMQPHLDSYFPPESGVSVIAEPGAYYVSSSFSLAVNIIAKKTVSWDQCGQPHEASFPKNEPAFLYYMNDGVYGSFSCKLLDDTVPAPSVHKALPAAEPLFVSSLWGPSCDGLDQVVERCMLPELSVGDWVVFGDMGAHSLGEPSTFTSVDRPPVYYVVSTRDWYEMQDAGINLDTPVKNFTLLPYCFQFNEQEDVFAPA